MRIKHTYFLFICICMLIVLGATNALLTFVSMFMSFIVAMIIATQKDKSVEICKGILLLLFMQNFCIGIGAHFFGNQSDSLKLLTQIPFMTIAIIWVFKCLLKYDTSKTNRERKIFYVLLIIIFFSLLIGRGTVQSILVTVRNLTVFYMAYEIGIYCISSDNEKEELVKYTIDSAVLLSIIGIPMMLGGYELYRFFGIHEIYIAKAAGFAEGSLDGRFYTSLFSNRNFIRMGSIVFEPINLAYILALGLLCALYYNTYRGFYKYLSLIVIGIGLIFTFGKGGYMIVGLVICFITAEKMFNSISKLIGRKVFTTLLIITSSVCLYLFVDYYAVNYGLAVLNHIWGIQNTFVNVLKRPWGYGLGTGGNVAFALGGSTNDWLSSGGETALMSFMYQIGIQGVFVIIILFGKISRRFIRRRTVFEKVLLYLPAILLFTALMQDNTFTPQCIVPYMIMIGAFSNIDVHRDNNNRYKLTEFQKYN